MNWFRRPVPVPPPAIVERLEAVEDGQARLERRLLKLQGEVTGAIRYQRELERQNRELEDELADGDDEPLFDGRE